MASEGRAFRFARNVGWNALGQVLAGAANFLLIPYLVGRMGAETYGLYILMHAAAGYLMLLSLGCGTPTVIYVAQFAAAKDGRGLKDVLTYSGCLYALGALLGTAGLGLGAHFCAVRVFHVPGPLVGEAVFVLRCAAGAAIFVALLQFGLSVMQGLQRFDWQNLIMSSQGVLMPLGAAGMISLGLGLAGVGRWYAALSAVLCLFSLAAAWRLIRPALEFAPGKGLPLSSFAVYTLSLAVGPLAWMVMFQFDKLFIARYASMTDLTLYGVPSGLLQRLQVLPAIMSTVLAPMMSEVQGPRPEEDLARMYLRTVRCLLWAVLPAFALLFALMPQFLGLWLGGDFGGRSVWPARLLVLAQTIFVVTFVPNAAAISRGRPWYLSFAVVAQAVISLVSWWWLIPRYKILGAAAGSLLAQALPVGVYLHLVHKRVLGLSSSRYLSEGLSRPALSAALLLALVFPIHAMATSWLRLVFMAAAGALVYYGSTWRFLNAEDRDLLRKYLKWEPRAAGGV